MSSTTRLEITWSDDSLALLRDALGIAVLEQYEDNEVTDIFLRPRWTAVETLSKGFVVLERLLEGKQIAAVLAILATAIGKELSLAKPGVEITMRLSENGPRVRFTGLYSGPGGIDSFLTMRVARVKDMSWEEVVRSAVVPQEVVGPLSAHLSHPRPIGILVAGPVGVGKTTFLRVLIKFIIENGALQHCVIVEDDLELDFEDTPLVTNIPTSEFFSFVDAVRQSKRHRPTRLVIGEVRGAEALPAVKAGAAGMGLLMSIHADTAAGAVRMLQGYMAEAKESTPPDPAVICDAVKIILVMARNNNKFFIREAVYLNSITEHGIDATPLYKRKDF